MFSNKKSSQAEWKNDRISKNNSFRTALFAIIIGIAFLMAAQGAYEIISSLSYVSSDILSETGKFKQEIESSAGGNVTITEGNVIQHFIPRVISLSLQVFGLVMLIILVIAGIYLVAGGVDESFIAEAKNMIYYSIIGAVIVTISFAIVYGITQINWTEW